MSAVCFTLQNKDTENYLEHSGSQEPPEIEGKWTFEIKSVYNPHPASGEVPIVMAKIFHYHSNLCTDKAQSEIKVTSRAECQWVIKHVAANVKNLFIIGMEIGDLCITYQQEEKSATLKPFGFSGSHQMWYIKYDLHNRLYAIINATFPVQLVPHSSRIQLLSCKLWVKSPIKGDNIILTGLKKQTTDVSPQELKRNWTLEPVGPTIDFPIRSVVRFIRNGRGWLAHSLIEKTFRIADDEKRIQALNAQLEEANHRINELEERLREEKSENLSLESKV